MAWSAFINRHKIVYFACAVQLYDLGGLILVADLALNLPYIVPSVGLVLVQA